MARADVEHRLSGQRVWKAGVLEKRRQIILAGRDDPSTKVEHVVPLVLGNAAADLFRRQ